MFAYATHLRGIMTIIKIDEGESSQIHVTAQKREKKQKF